MTDLIRRDWYWLNYLPDAQNTAQFVSDITQTDLSFPLILPPWLPRKLAICSITVGYSYFPGKSDGDPAEVYALVDPKGKFYKTGKPPGSDTQLDTALGDECITLMYSYMPPLGSVQQNFATFPLDTPVWFDRDGGDKLWFGINGANNAIFWVYMALGFLQPSPIPFASLPLVGAPY